MRAKCVMDGCVTKGEPMSRAKDESGEPPPGRDGQRQDKPFDEKAWRRKYMKMYMQRKRERQEFRQRELQLARERRWLLKANQAKDQAG